MTIERTESLSVFFLELSSDLFPSIFSKKSIDNKVVHNRIKFVIDILRKSK
jgi:hypothetical protein